MKSSAVQEDKPKKNKWRGKEGLYPVRFRVVEITPLIHTGRALDDKMLFGT